MALRYVLKGQLLFSPLAPHIQDDGGVVLDIQGIFRDQWSWQMALDFPKAMIYGFKLVENMLVRATEANTVTAPTSTNSEAVSEGIPSKYHVDGTNPCTEAAPTPGPTNYVRCVGHSFTQMPFEDCTFDVISAKSLWYYVPTADLTAVLSEFHRILKPGGYIELVCSDFTILNGSASDEYWWGRLRGAVRAKGLDPRPSIRMPANLYAAGFTDVNCALLALPRGWGGQIGHLTDLLSLYYSESMFRTFSDLTAEELEGMKVGGGPLVSSSVTMVYARK